MARIERAWLDAYHAADIQPLIPHALASNPPEQLADTISKPNPAARIVRSRFPAVTIFTQIGATARPVTSRLSSQRTLY